MLAGMGLLAAVTACNGLTIIPTQPGNLWVNVMVESSLGVQTKSGGTQGVHTKSGQLDDYVFLLMNAAGDTLEQTTVGAVAGAPLSLEPGNYRVVTYNQPFTTPAFDTPYYYAQADALVESGTTCEVTLSCTQANAGVRILFTEAFTAQYPEYQMRIVQPQGTLRYDAGTAGWGYFHPGNATLWLTAQDDTLGNTDKTLHAKYMYTYTVDYNGIGQEQIAPTFTLSVDTTHVWISSMWDSPDNNQSGTSDGLSQATAYSIAQARALSGDVEDVWVTGYIVGTMTSGGNLTTSAFTVATNLALSDSPTSTLGSDCFPISLTAGALRDSCNLVDHPTHVGKRIWLRGKTKAPHFGQPCGFTSINAMSW